MTTALVTSIVVPFAHSQVKSAAEIGSEGRAAYDAKQFGKAGELYQSALDRGLKSPSEAYNGACAYALAGETDKAFAMLERALQLGWMESEATKSDRDLTNLHSDSRWDIVLQKTEANRKNYLAVHSEPDGAKFVTSDVELFWSVYDQLPNAKDPIELLTTKYLDSGTLGLQEFIPGRIMSAKNLYATIQKFPRYYAAIRPNTLKVATVEPQVRESFHKFKGLYDDAMFPDVYFVVGAMNSGGTSGSQGLLLGAEMHGMSPGVPTDELTPWVKTVVKPYTILPNIIAHELIHFQQKHDGKSLLAKSIHEGSADFLASLISDGNFNRVTYDYGYAHETELWKKFKSQMQGEDASEWLYGASQRDGHPADLGYFMGFRISQAYYNRAKDKKQAIRDILQVTDFQKLLDESGYAEKFK